MKRTKAQLADENAKLRALLTHRAGPRMSYDAVSGSSATSGGGNKRRRALVEYDDEDTILRLFDRNRALNLTRDGLRNYAMHRSMVRQQRVNVVGPLGKLIVLADPQGWGRDAQSWFNSAWAPQCDFFSGQHWGTFLQLVVAALANEGDLCAAFDDGTITGDRGSGRIIAWESDQITNLQDEQFKSMFPAGWRQENGLIFDQYNRETGIVVSGKRGLSTVSADEAFILRTDPKLRRREQWWTHIKRTFRLRQGRGIPDALTSVNLLLDTYEMLSKELQSAKVAAGQYASVKRAQAETNFDDPKFDPTQPLEEGENVAAAAATLPEDQTEPVSYERLEALTGGYTDYIDPQDEVTLHDPKRPNVNMAGFIDFTTDMAGAPFGLAHAYSRMRADSSYTAFRGDMVMTWVSFRDNQKDIERQVADWAAVNAINWAVKTGQLAAGPDGWADQLAWQWPKMPEVNEVDAQNAVALKFKNCTTTLADELGPMWREIVDQIAVEQEYLRSKKVVFSAFESKSGAPQTVDKGNAP